jgi:hypothetical protein
MLKFTPDAAIAEARAKSPDQGRSLEAAIRAELLDHVLAGDANLEDFTVEEQKYLDYAIVCKLRAAAYVRVVAAMAPAPELEAWAAAMTARYGPTCRIHAHELPWLPALRVVRWGEEPAHWPASWEDSDLKRAADWLAGDHPTFMTYLIGAERTPITPRPGRMFNVG